MRRVVLIIGCGKDMGNIMMNGPSIRNRNSDPNFEGNCKHNLSKFDHSDYLSWTTGNHEYFA